jgi:putative ABC transport system permease protein
LATNNELHRFNAFRYCAADWFLEVAMSACLVDIRHALTWLRRNPGYSAAVTCILTLGIGANIFVFGLANAVTWRALPFGDAKDLVSLIEIRGAKQSPLSYRTFLALREHNDAFEDLVADQSWVNFFSTPEGTELVNVQYVSSGYFRVLRVPIVGREFLPIEDRPGGTPAVMISEQFWRNHFHGDAELIGKPVAIGGRAHTVIGITPSWYSGYQKADIFISLAAYAARMGCPNGCSSVRPIGRLRPGVTAKQAAVRMSGIVSQLAEHDPGSGTAAGYGVDVRDLRETLYPWQRPVALLLLAFAEFTLLVACLSVAVLALAKLVGRSKEVAMRLALGASRFRAVRQFTAESLVLSVSSGVLGLVLSLVGFRLVGLANIDFLGTAVIVPDGRVLAYAVAISVLTGLVVGVFPTFRVSNARIMCRLQESATSVTRPVTALRLLKILACAQAAIAVLLLVHTGLLRKSLQHLVPDEPGFDATSVLTFWVDYNDTSRYRLGTSESGPMTQRLLAEIEMVPGVVSTAVADYFPGDSPAYGQIVTVAEATRDAQVGEAVTHRVGRGYMRTLGISLLSGRWFSESESPPTRVAVINETMAHRFWLRKEQAVGALFRLSNEVYSVIGVVNDTRGGAGLAKPTPEVYLAARGGAAFFVRTTGEPTGLARAVRARIQPLTRDAAVRDFKTLKERLSDQKEVAVVQLASYSSSIFAALALLLAWSGMSAIASMSTEYRTRELGIRAAFGASPRAVCALLLRGLLLPACAGGACGLAAAYATTPMLANGLFGVQPTDVCTLLSATALLGMIEAVAIYPPLRYVLRLEPAASLRHE